MKNAVRLEDQKNRIAMFAGYVNNFNGLYVKRNADVGRFKTGIISLMLGVILSMAMVCNGYAQVVNTKLNGEWDVVGLIYGDVSSAPQISPDGSYVVYVADQDTDEVDELYSVPIGGGTATKLNDPMVVGGNVRYSFKISPDSSRVVYLADQDTNGVNELYSVPIGGGTVIKLSGGGVHFNDSSRKGFAISPDSSRVVYLAEQDTDGVNELYSVPIGGGTITKLSDAMVSGGDVYYSYDYYSYESCNGFSISSDSSWVVYLADQDTDNVIELYSVPIGGGTVTKLNDTLIGSGKVHTYKISANSSRVVYCADQDTENIKELYSVPIEGGTITKLNSPIVSGIGIISLDDDIYGFFFGYELSPDSNSVVYLAHVHDTDIVPELYSVPIGGGTVTKLTNNLVSGSHIYWWRFEISADSSQVVYIECQYLDEIYELFSVPIGGGTPTWLGDNLSIRGFQDDSYYFAVSADSSRVVFPRSDGLYSAPIGGGSVTKLNNTLVSGGEIDDFILSADSSRVVYRADQDTDDVDELYSVPIGGGAVTKLNDPMVSGGDVYSFQSYVLSADSSRVVYRADQDTDEVFELYSVPIEDGAVTKLNPALAIGEGGSLNYRVSPDSSRVVYCANQDTEDVFELYSVPIGGGTITKLNDPMVVGGNVSSRSFEISPDSSRVVYWADQDTDTIGELYSVPVVGGTVTKLSDPLDMGRNIGDFSISPDSSRVIYRAYQDTDEIPELFSVPIGGGTVTKLNAALISGGEVYGYMISPDSSWVIYSVKEGYDSVPELYSVPIGGGTATKLSETLVYGGSISSFNISPDSSRVIYRADQEVDERDELYSVAIGGGTITKLNGPLTFARNVRSFSISPDSTRVVYNAYPDGAYELFSVPIGGGTITKLNDIMVSIYSFDISPDSSRVVYMADQDTDSVDELYSVPIGGGAVTKLNSPLILGENVYNFMISPDSTRVVYKADQDTDEFYELYSVPIGGGTVTKLNDATVWIYSFEISADSSRVVYMPTPEAYTYSRVNIVELFSVPINGGTVTKQNDTLPGGLKIPSFTISPDSSRVVYITQSWVTDKIMGLYSSTIIVPGDFNNDGCVDRADYYIMIADIRGPAPHDMAYDLNEDGIVNIADARYLARLFTNPRGAACD